MPSTRAVVAITALAGLLVIAVGAHSASADGLAHRHAITVEVVVHDERQTPLAMAAVRSVGGRVVAHSGPVVLAHAPRAELARLANLVRGEVREPLAVDVAPQREATHFGPTAGAAVEIVGAEEWHLAGLAGTGVRIGVVDFFDTIHWDTAEHGPLPIAGTTARCFDTGADCTADFFDGDDEGGDDHGVAVVEAILDVAPGAEILIGKATTITDYRALIEWFDDRDVDIISRSLGSRYDGPGDGRSLLGDVASDAVARGMLWVNSAGNNGDDSYYRHAVRLVGDRVAFGPSGDATFLRFKGCVALAGIRWANDWDRAPSDRTDYDAYLWESPTGDPAAGTIVDRSERRQGLGATPLEHLPDDRCPAAGKSLYLELRWRGGGSIAGDVIEILDYGSGMAAFTQARRSAAVSVVDSKDPGIVAVGAIDPAAGGTIADYSSQGPTNDGRIAPDLVAPAGFTSAVSTFFSGTSAAAAITTGCAALMLAAPLASNTIALADLLRHTTIDRGATGADSVYGHGEIRLPPPPGPIDATPSRFRALEVPRRLLDTRPSTAVGPPDLIGEITRGDILELPVTDVAGLPAAGVTAVAINLVTVAPDRASWLQALPTHRAALAAFANVNTDAASQVRANFAIVPVGDRDTISMYATADGHAVVDVLGWFEAAPIAAAAGRFVPLPTAQRLLDTRFDAPIAPIASRGTRDVPMLTGVPAAQIEALVVTITAASPTAAGWLQAYPADRDDIIGTTANVNTAPDSTVANTAIVPVGSGGIALTGFFAGGGSSHAVVDAVGYITSEAAPADTRGRFVPVRPDRAFDSRLSGGPLTDRETVDVRPSDAPGVTVPASATGVVWNLAITGPTRAGFVRGWAAGASEPVISSLNWTSPGEIRSTGSITSIASGRVRFRMEDGAANLPGPVGDLVADVFGYFT